MTTTLRHPRYQLDSWIAAGGMGEVWQATDMLLDREVAVKVLRRELAADPVLRARFAAEARHAGALQHPHVASVLDYGELSGPGSEQGPTPLPFLVMELVEGQPLSAMLAGRQPVAPQLAAELIAQAAEGIEAAHALGIVHRDVKPGNLLVTPEGQVKVTDFGVARAVDTASLTMTGHLIGTPHYLSPEQAEGGAATAVSDVYSLGIVLYECLTGRKPFAAETPVATAVMQIREPLPAFPDSVPERLQRIARVATAKDPAARFRSAGAMAAALRDESPDTRGYLLPALAAAGSIVEPATDATGATDVPERRGPFSGRRVLVGVLTLLLASGAVWATTAYTDDRVGAQPTEAAAQNDAADSDRVRIRADQFVGRDAGEATRALRDLGLRARTERRPNPGQEVAGIVAAISPTGLLEPGSVVRLSVWSEPPAPQPVPIDGAGSEAPDAGGGRAAGGSGGTAGADNGPGGGTAAGSGGQSSSPGRSGSSNGSGGGNSNAGGNGSSNSGGNSNAGGNSGGNGGNGQPGKSGKG